MSEYQQGIINNYLAELLTYKLEQYKESNKGVNISKEKTHIYLDACVVFLYENKIFRHR